jgi:hypothetical protein
MFDAIQNELQYRFGTKAALEGNIQKDAATNTYQPTAIQSLLGLTSGQLTTAANTGDRNRFMDDPLGQEALSYGVKINNTGPVNRVKVRKDLNEAKNLETISNAYLAQGGDPSKLVGQNSAGASSLLRDRKQTNANEAWENSPQTKQEQDRYYDLQQDKLADRKDARDQLTFSREDAQNQRMFARRESALDRAQTQDLAILSQGHQMKLAQMNQDLAEKRMGYDRETKRMDRRDAMIAQLLAGLGQLGSAF